MSDYEIYILILCLIVFILLTTLSVTMLTVIVKLMIKLIRSGAEDEKIRLEYENTNNNKNKGRFIDCIFSLIICIILLGFFVFSLYINISQNKYFDDIPTIKVVNTASMSKKHEDNKYLLENNLNNQFNTFDLILVYKIPKVEDLKLYDIVVYEVDDVLIVHRIVGIEEPNEKHCERWFLLQGDAVESPDRFPVRYEQMRAIYRGERIPFIGSFVSFMQSPAGWICILLVITAYIASPIIAKIIEKEKMKRLALLGAIIMGENSSNGFPYLYNADVIVSTLSNENKENDLEKQSDNNEIENDKNITSNDEIINESSKENVDNVSNNEIMSNSEEDFEKQKKELESIEKENFDKQENNDNGINYKIKPIRNQIKSLETEENMYSKFKSLSFEQKLEKASETVKNRYNVITNHLKTLEKIRVIESKSHETFKKGHLPIVKLEIKDKTLNAYLNHDTKEFENTKYIFTDVSNVKKNSQYPMRVKVTSDRQAKWVCELIEEVLLQQNKEGNDEN